MYVYLAYDCDIFQIWTTICNQQEYQDKTASTSMRDRGRLVIHMTYLPENDLGSEVYQRIVRVTS